jgi:hypothetical protein
MFCRYVCMYAYVFSLGKNWLSGNILPISTTCLRENLSRLTSPRLSSPCLNHLRCNFGRGLYWSQRNGTRHCHLSTFCFPILPCNRLRLTCRVLKTYLIRNIFCLCIVSPRNSGCCPSWNWNGGKSYLLWMMTSLISKNAIKLQSSRLS